MALGIGFIVVYVAVIVCLSVPLIKIARLMLRHLKLQKSLDKLGESMFTDHSTTQSEEGQENTSLNGESLFSRQMRNTTQRKH